MSERRRGDDPHTQFTILSAKGFRHGCTPLSSASDFLLLVLKDLIVQRSDLRIILMSATLNAHLFSDYFYNCPSIHIPGRLPSPMQPYQTFHPHTSPHGKILLLSGRTFPVDQFFLEDAIAKSK